MNRHDLDSNGLGSAPLLEPGCDPMSYAATGAFVRFSPDRDLIVFKGQTGPVKEKGVNGAQVDDLIRAASAVVESLNRAFPCDENEKCLHHLHDALAALDRRTRRRTKAGIEGTNAESPPKQPQTGDKTPPAEDDPSDGA